MSTFLELPPTWQDPLPAFVYLWQIIRCVHCMTVLSGRVTFDCSRLCRKLVVDPATWFGIKDKVGLLHRFFIYSGFCEHVT